MSDSWFYPVALTLFGLALIVYFIFVHVWH